MTRPSLEAALVHAVPAAPVLDIAVPVTATGIGTTTVYDLTARNS